MFVLGVSEKLIGLLVELRQVFVECQTVTETLCVCPAEDMPALVEERGGLLDRAGELDAECRTLCGGDRNLLAALDHTCTREELPPAAGEVYEAALLAKGAARTVLRNEEMVRERLSMEMAGLLVKIESMNTSGSAVAERYGRSVQTGVPGVYQGRQGTTV